jgi:hypothetical protein
MICLWPTYLSPDAFKHSAVLLPTMLLSNLPLSTAAPSSCSASVQTHALPPRNLKRKRLLLLPKVAPKRPPSKMKCPTSKSVTPTRKAVTSPNPYNQGSAAFALAPTAPKKPAPRAIEAIIGLRFGLRGQPAKEAPRLHPKCSTYQSIATRRPSSARCVGS